MIRNITAIALASLLATTVNATTPPNPAHTFIDNRDYNGLKKHLYLAQPDVLRRSGGYSALDYAIVKRDKRAAIIIADYNNSSINQRRLRAIELEISNLDKQIQGSASTKEITKIIDRLKSEKLDLQSSIYEESKKESDKKFAELEHRIEELERKAMPPEVKSTALENKKFFEETLRLNN
jgi:hypothetical protein